MKGKMSRLNERWGKRILKTKDEMAKREGREKEKERKTKR